MKPTDDFDALFAASATPTPAPLRPLWKILLVDDEPDVHAVLNLTLNDITFNGGRLIILEARSAQEARQLLKQHPDIALLLLDVVMETHSAGLDLVREVRASGSSSALQIILVTGQPGYAPQREVITSYGINGYCLKSELTVDRIFSLVYAGLRTYALMRDLAESEARYRALNAELEARVEHRTATLKRTNTELMEARDVAQRANRAKSMFLANMSHELRTPLNAILGFTQLTARDDRLLPDLKSNLEIVYKNSQHLLSLINDVLEISQIEAGQFRTEARSVDLRGLVDEVLAIVGARAKEKALTLRLEWGLNLPNHVVLDVGKARQILLNLLSNAVKYTEHGEIILAVRARPSEANLRETMLTFEVRDTGVGIEAEALDAIFKPFFQAKYGAELGQGVGLGLSICQERAQLLGGTINVESAPGEGSIFKVSLPTESTPIPELQRRAPPQPRGEQRFKLLVAEKSYDNRMLFHKQLTEAGFQVRCAGDGEMALSIFEGWGPDLIFMDTRLPKINGLATTRLIRRRPGGAEVPVIALTASIFEEERVEMLNVGFSAVAQRPLEEDTLFEMLNAWLPDLPNPAASSEVEIKQAPSVSLDLSCLSAAQRGALCAAAELLDLEGTRVIVEEIAAQMPTLAAALAQTLEAYQFDKLIAACEVSSGA